MGCPIPNVVHGKAIGAKSGGKVGEFIKSVRVQSGFKRPILNLFKHQIKILRSIRLLEIFSVNVSLSQDGMSFGVVDIEASNLTIVG